MKYLIARKTGSLVPIELFTKSEFKAALGKLPKSVKNWVGCNEFEASSGQICLLPSRDGKIAKVLAGVSRHGDLWQYARLSQRLPKGRYCIETKLDEAQANAAALGWMLGTYSFTRYREDTKIYPSLLWPGNADRDLVSALATATALGRDLINTPAEDMGPAELSLTMSELGKQHGAQFREIVGDALLEQNYPSVHAVGRAASRAPRLLDLSWGNAEAPLVTLVGKGVCFDSGGLGIKPADAMKLMKKDMGGAATVLAIASVIMTLELPIRLRVLIPAVENAISGNAFRPLDVLRTRKGVTVEVGHTDAEGRLILSDALTEADSENPALLIDMATLTGAARVALGTSLPALFSPSRQLAEELLQAGSRADDPLWRLPLHRPYRRMLDSKVADLCNVSTSSFAGAITAGLFLQEFVSKSTAWIHIDTMAFNLESKSGRPYGGEVMGMRAIVEMLRTRYGKESTGKRKIQLEVVEGGKTEKKKRTSPRRRARSA